MNIERLLLTTLSFAEDVPLLDKVKQLRLLNHKFAKANEGVYKFVISFIEKYNEAPSPQLLAEEFPGYDFSYNNEPFSFAVDKAVRLKKQNQVTDGLASVEKLLAEGKLDDAHNQFILAARSFERAEIKSHDIDVKKDYDYWAEEYKSIRDSGESMGLKTGISYIDNITHGIQDGDYWVFAARPKQLKSWIMSWIFTNTGQECEDCNILFVSKEMTKAQIYKRVIAILGGVSYDSVRKHELTDEELEIVKNRINQKLKANLVIVGKGEYEVLNASFIKAKIIEYQPRVVFVDGLYLFGQSEKWEEQAQMSRQMRSIALDTNTPIVGTLQFNKKGMGVDNLAYSDAFLQDVTVLVGMERKYNDILGRPENKIRLKLLAVREGESDGETMISIGFKKSQFVEGNVNLDGDDLLEVPLPAEDDIV